MDIMQGLRQHVKGEELDYVFLLNYLKDYSKPRDKISRLLKRKDLIRVKKGLYVFGERYRRELISLGVLANLIYGPSYISLEYALAYYGLIPERVVEITSVTTHKNKSFKTPLGIFTYQHMPVRKYVGGIYQLESEGGGCFLMASPEKALSDVISRQHFRNAEELRIYLMQGLRIEEESLTKLNQSHLIDIAKAYRHPSVTLLKNLIHELGNTHE